MHWNTIKWPRVVLHASSAATAHRVRLHAASSCLEPLSMTFGNLVQLSCAQVAGCM